MSDRPRPDGDAMIEAFRKLKETLQTTREQAAKDIIQQPQETQPKEAANDVKKGPAGIARKLLGKVLRKPNP
jgi:hypothetical protein